MPRDCPAHGYPTKSKMKLNTDSEKPIYLQIAEQIENAVFTGAYPEETQIPSTTEISTLFKINPATVLKGMNLLVDDGILYKKRGLGMFVKTGAKQAVCEKRQSNFYKDYVESLISEARKLGLSKAEITELIERGYGECASK